MFEQIAKLVFAVVAASIGLGLGLPSLAEYEASTSPEPWICADLLRDRPEGWVQVSGCQLDLAVALYEEDGRTNALTRAWVPSTTAPVPGDGTPSPLVVRTDDADTLANLTWGRDAVAAAGEDEQALRNVLETFQQAGARHLTGRVTWRPTPVMARETGPLHAQLTEDAGFLSTEPPPWLPGWGWTLVGVFGVLFAIWTSLLWYRDSASASTSLPQ